MTALHQLFGGELPRLVMFDLDGTLLDSVPDLAAAIDRMLGQLGRPPAGVAKVRDWVGNGSKVLVRRALANDLDYSAISEEQAAPAHQLFLTAYADCHALSTVYLGVRECLDWLRARAVPLALVTNKPIQFVGPLLAEKGLAEAAVAPVQALFVGDSRNDVLAARAAGVPCVALTYGYNHGRPIAEEQPALVLDDLRQLVDSTGGLG